MLNKTIMKKTLTLSAAVVCLTSAAFSAPAKAPAKKAAQLTDVMICPMTQSAVRGRGSGTQVVGKHRVHFCCAGCRPEFNKLSKAGQQKKTAAALKKQQAVKAKV